MGFSPCGEHARRVHLLLRLQSTFSPTDGTTSRLGNNRISFGTGVRGISGDSRRHFRAGTDPKYADDMYDVLGVPKSASDGEIKRAYLKKAKELHPDTNNDDPEAAAKFQQVQRAYEVLKDKEKRRMYDQVGPDQFENFESGGNPFAGGGRQGGAGMNFDGNPFGGFGFRHQQGGGFQDFSSVEDLFSEFFGGVQRRGQTLAVEVMVNFDEAAFGCNKVIDVATPVPGKHNRGGFAKENRRLRITIPPGIEDNATLKMRGEGAPGPPGGAAGDLVVYVRVAPHKVFRREGPHLHLNLNITLSQAVLGASVPVPTLDEGNLLLKVRPGTQPEEVNILRGKGVPLLGNRHTRGNMYVKFKLTVPESISRRQRELMEEFQQIEEAEQSPGDGSSEDVHHHN